MPLNFAMSVMIVAEFLLWAVAGFIFWKKNLQRRFPAMGAYLTLRLGSMPVLLALLYMQSMQTGHQALYFPLYFYSYWTVYIASAFTLFFICIEVFRTALAPYTGLMRLGTVVFRWTTLASLIVSMSSVSFSHHGALLIPDIALALMRSVSILELCLLAFLCLCMNALKLSARDICFGVALGFGILSTNDFIFAAVWSRHSSLTSPIQFVNEGVLLATLGMWAVYFAVPEKVHVPLVLAPNSTIYRWNEIAAALGHGTKVAVQQPANSFFLSDVEKVVDKVLTRTNLQGSESK
ncbi:MAG TPA: hypothetical protein VG893_12265 [Terracidiphilus sp.]|nr:hypothetical protein [Terracidiphilus sp.]